MKNSKNSNYFKRKNQLKIHATFHSSKIFFFLASHKSEIKYRKAQVFIDTCHQISHILSVQVLDGFDQDSSTCI